VTRLIIGALVLAVTVGCGGAESADPGACSHGGNLVTGGDLLGSSSESKLALSLAIFQGEMSRSDELPAGVRETVQRYEQVLSTLSTPVKPGRFRIDRTKEVIAGPSASRLYLFPTARHWVCAIEGDAQASAPVCWFDLVGHLAWVAISGRCDRPGLTVFGVVSNQVTSVEVLVGDSSEPAIVRGNAFYWSTARDTADTGDVDGFRLQLADGTHLTMPATNG
jgi:hypothetical protein